jgi:hypothetical protein
MEVAADPAAGDRREELIAAVLWDVKALTESARELGRGELTLVDEDVLAAVGDVLRSLTEAGESGAAAAASGRARVSAPGGPAVVSGILALSVIRAQGGGHSAQAARLFDQWRLGPQTARMFSELDLGHPEARVDTIRTLLAEPQPIQADSVENGARMVLASWVDDERAQRAMGVNEWEDTIWITGDLYAALVETWAAHQRLMSVGGIVTPSGAAIDAIAGALLEAAPAAGYHFDRLLDAVPVPTAETPPPRTRRRATSPKTEGGAPATGASDGKVEPPEAGIESSSTPARPARRARKPNDE